MKNWNWYFNRLKAMSVREMLWRLSRQLSQHKEKARFSRQPVSVSAGLFDKKFSGWRFNEEALGIHFSNRFYSLRTDIRLLGGYDYAVYRKKWHSDFQTGKEWPLTFSYELNYKQQEGTGDARTNWELNRHFQLALLAKNFYASRNPAYLAELDELFQDWNRNNPFLYGISWTSVMEVAIRAISWMYALAFLRKAQQGPVEERLMNDMQTGILNMVEYVSLHYSRFSSANNHLVVEATAVALAGLAFGCERWRRQAMAILTEELYKQNYADGVNKELSLHYQTFVMEAYGLTAHAMQANRYPLPKGWEDSLNKMCVFVSHSLWKERAACEFGDNDEGKIIDLSGGTSFSHYSYVLQLCSLVLGKRYSDFENKNETICWLFTGNEIRRICEMPCYDNSRSRCFRIGGNTFLRDKANRILIGIDHAALGFGKLAAHGHADALSFQLLIDGRPLFIDPGTYIYHCSLEERNEFRKTIRHNTVCINGKDQSEMLGAFLWGRKAATRLIEAELGVSQDRLTAETDAYAPVMHRRSFLFDKDSCLKIEDSFSGECAWCVSFLLSPGCKVGECREGKVEIRLDEYKCVLDFTAQDSSSYTFAAEETFVSPAYGIKETASILYIKGKLHQFITHILWQ